MINIVTTSKTPAIGLDNVAFLITGITRGVEVVSPMDARDQCDLNVFVGYSAARLNGVTPSEPYSIGFQNVSRGCKGIVIPTTPKDGSVEQLLTRRGIWAVKMPSLYDMPFGEFYRNVIHTPDGSRGSSPLSGAGLACVQWLTKTLGHYPSLDEQAAAVAAWELDRHARIKFKAMGRPSDPGPLCRTMAGARMSAKMSGVTLAKVAKETAPSRWNVTTTEALIPILLGGE